MSFLYENGFFPYPILPVAQLDPASIATYDKITGLNISTLSRLFWAWKTCSITADLSFVQTGVIEGGPDDVQTTSGTITGSAIEHLGNFGKGHLFPDLEHNNGFLFGRQHLE